MHKHAKQPKKANGSSFLQKQLQQERKNINSLRLKSASQEILQARHSTSAIVKFFTKYRHEIKKEKEHYLYQLEAGTVDVNATFLPNWCKAEKSIYKLESALYCLFTRAEYKAALEQEMDKAVFINIKSRRDSLKKLSEKQRKTKKQKPICISITEDEEDSGLIDVFRVEEVFPEKEEKVIKPSTTLCIRKPVKTAKPEIVLEKEEKVTNHIETILNFDPAYEEPPKPITTLSILEQPVKKTKSKDKSLKRYREYEDVEELQTKVARLTEDNRLERELRSLEQELITQRLYILEKRFESMSQSLKEKDQEIQALRRTQKSTDPAITPKRKKVVPKSKKGEEQQSSLEQFMIVPYQEENGPTLTETVNMIVQNDPFSAQMEQEEACVLANLVVHSDTCVTNVGIPFTYKYKLSVYLEKFLAKVNDPTRNQHLYNLMAHPFIENYKLYLWTNMHVLSPSVLSSPEFGRFHLEQQQQVLKRDSLEVRINLSAINIHSWFLAKAIKYEKKADDGQLPYKPVIMQNFPYSYAPEILQKWYPYLDAGNGYIITHDLKIPAKSVQHGQGHGKHCCFCGFQYIASSEGRLKHAHQVKNCDYIANMSNDERVILYYVLKKREVCQEFRDHDFIRKYDKKTLLRRATDEEISKNKYLTCEVTGDKLRINMPVLLGMRERAYTRFIERIKSLDTHDYNMEDKLKNLDATPIAHQLDVFGLTPFSGPTFYANDPVPPIPLSKSSVDKAKKNRAPKNSDRPQKIDGFLYKTLLDYDGKLFRRTKFTEDGKASLRDFTFNEATGFGDDMFYSANHQPLPFLFPITNASIPFMPSLADQLAPHMHQQLPLPTQSAQPIQSIDYIIQQQEDDRNEMDEERQVPELRNQILSNVEEIQIEAAILPPANLPLNFFAPTEMHQSNISFVSQSDYIPRDESNEFILEEEENESYLYTEKVNANDDLDIVYYKTRKY